MYEIFCDNKILYKPNEKDLALLNPKLSLEINNAGSFQFAMPVGHPLYEEIKKFTSFIEVKNDGETVFCGRPVEENIDFFKSKTIYCEGELAFLNDSIQRPSESHDITVRGFLELLINNHNSQVEESKRFTVGTVTVTDSNDSLYRYTNYENTMTAIKEKLLERLDGYLVIRHVNGVRYIDYLEEMPDTCSQTIEFGQNLLDYASNIDATDIATRLIPLGAKLEESQFTAIDERVTIKSVNGGLDYIQAEDAVTAYGIVTKVQTWDDVNDPSILKTKGQDYLESIQWENMTLNVTAVDLHSFDVNVEAINIGDKILVVSKPHGLKKYFPVKKMDIDLSNPANNKFQLGTSYDVSISSKSNSVGQTAEQAKNLPVSTWLQSAKENASALIKAATNGYIVLHMSESGTPDELLIMDTPDINTATKVWRWNVNGLGYSNTGYNGTYGLAMTMDGSIVADMITTGTMYADRVKGGTFSVGGNNNESGVIQVLNENGEVIGKWTKDGIQILRGKIKGVSIETNDANITGGSIRMITSNKDYDLINLNYTAQQTGESFASKMAPSTISLYHNGTRGTHLYHNYVCSELYAIKTGELTMDAGATGTFVDKNGKTITVKGGIITSII